MPARACRMLGEGQFCERLNVLHFFALNPKASPFTRRDAMIGLRKMETADKASIEVLLKGLKDKYFETVNEALYALNVLLVKHRAELEDSFSETEKQVRPFLRSKEYDQRMNDLECLLRSLIPGRPLAQTSSQLFSSEMEV